MSLSQDLFQLQEYDTVLDKARSRLVEIDRLLADRRALDAALKNKETRAAFLQEKQEVLGQAEQQVVSQNQKIETNQRRLYGGAVTNPKELEDLQLEYSSLMKYLSVLEERQLEAMVDAEAAQSELGAATAEAVALAQEKNRQDQALEDERVGHEQLLAKIEAEKNNFLARTAIPDLALYQQLRNSLNGIAVTLMISDSCASCGSNIPSAIAQEVRSQKKVTCCPTCKRILHPG